MGARTIQSSSLGAKNENPGPGAYAPVDVNHHVSAKFSLKGKHYIGTQIVITPDGGHEQLVESNEKFPGPGSYHSKTDLVFKNFGSSKFGHEKRPGMNNVALAKTPAPNAYNREAKSVVLNSAPSYGFGTSKRTQSMSTKFVPGPGTYT